MSSAGLENVIWPALEFGSPRYNMGILSDGELLAVASHKGMRVWQQMETHFVIDSSSNRYDLKDLEFKEPLSGVKKVLFGFGSSTRPIRWQAELGGPQSVDEIKTLVLADLDKYETIWQASCDLDAIEKRVREAPSVREIITIFN